MSREHAFNRPVVGFGLRTAWVAVRLILVYYLGQQGLLFFYQTF